MRQHKKLIPKAGCLGLYDHGHAGRSLLINLSSELKRRFLEKEGVLVEPMIIDQIQIKEGFRLVFDLPKTTSEELLRSLRVRFDIHEDGKVSRIWAVPYSFLNPDLDDFLTLCKPRVKKYFPSLDKKGHLRIQLNVHNKAEEAKLYALVESRGYAVQHKQLSGRATTPGFIVNFQISESVAVKGPVTSGMAEQVVTALESLMTAWISSKSLKERLALIAIDAESLSRKELITIARAILPSTIGLYDKDNPFIVETHKAMVNEITG